MGPEDLLKAVRAVDLPEGFGFACFSAPGSDLDRRLLIRTDDDEVYRVLLCLDRGEKEFLAEVAVDSETKAEEFPALVGAAVLRLRQHAQESLPLVS